MATHSSILAWKIPWTEEPGGLLSTGSQRVRQDCACTLCVQRQVSGGQKSVKDGEHPPETLLPPQEWNHFLPP